MHLTKQKAELSAFFVNTEIDLFGLLALLAYEMIFFDKTRASKPSKKAIYFCNIAEKCNF
jgi:hypothetical protein